MTPLQLLAPARDAEIAKIAIMHGADAVYMGGPSHGARAAAVNTIEDIAGVVCLAHSFGARVYATLNTLVYEDEISSVINLVREYWRIGVDALIVQDMGLLRMSLPPIALHASTQCDIRSVEKACFLADAGFSQLVLPREFSLEQIRAVRQAVPKDVVLEAFVHGALCVSYSGDCQASCAANGRSANRGECAQMCRMAYDLVDDKGKVLLRNKHLLSLRDMCRLSDLEDMALAGISSFKIEGRLKDAAYVKNVVASYRKAIDQIIQKYPDRFCKASLGECSHSFAPDVMSAFNRGYTSYFLRADSLSKKDSDPKMANFDTPKYIGVPVGNVVSASPRMITAKLTAQLSNGDGLGFFNKKGEFEGFRLNRVEGNRLFPATAVNLEPGTALYRNRDVKRDAELARDTSVRTIPVEAELTWPLSLKLKITGDFRQVSVSAPCNEQQARTPQGEGRHRIVSKLGGTNYSLSHYEDKVPDDLFIPASLLTDLRRQAVALLDAEIKVTHQYEYRLPEKETAFPSQKLTYHDNVANSLARTFYADHGVTSIEPALEIEPQKGTAKVVMTTRYCLRRELGACLKEGGAATIPEPLFLKNKAATYRLAFDCARCQMQLLTK